MEVLKEITSMGEKLGLEGKELQTWIKEQQEALRDERHKEREAEKERVEKQMQLEKERYEREKELRSEEHKRKLELLELETKHVSKGKNPPTRNVAPPRTPKLPAFDETKDDMDAYLQRFERYAEIQNWESQEWAIHLSALLKGKALEAYARLPKDDALDFKKLKAALLTRFELTEEGFRKRFRSSKPEQGETFVQFSARLKNYFQRWLELANVSADDYDTLLDFIIRDQFLFQCGTELRLFLKERVPKSLKDMAEIADRYREARGGTAQNVIRRPTKPSLQENSATSQPSPRVRFGTTQTQSKDPARRDNLALEKRRCYQCNRYGHIAKKCPTLVGALDGDCFEENQEDGSQDVKPEVHQIGMCCATTPYQVTWTDAIPITKAATQVNYACGLNMPTESGTLNGHSVTVLRDTGCSGVVVRAEFVKASDMLGRFQQCTLVDGRILKVPLAEVVLETPYLKGRVQAMVFEQPIYDVIVGNVPGAKDPQMKTAAVVTRAQAKKAQLPYRPLSVPKAIGDLTDPASFKDEQQRDTSLRKCHQRATSGEQKVTKSGAVESFKYKCGFLYRIFYSPKIENGKLFTQLVVPTSYREQVLHISHDSLMAGHLKTGKTCAKILAQFFWPGVQSDVNRYCKSCDLCQKTVPKGKLTRVPLGSMPLIGTPFQRVAVDLVGPLDPPTDRGNRYILTLVDYATRYPEAVALKNVDSALVAEKLVDMFSRLGVPEEILSDLGRQFISELMKEVSRLLSLTQRTTTPYHPQCNGLVEKFNGTLKSMLKKMCAERPKDWDKYINPLLFAYREAPQDSTGFSPFELLYGRTVRGPLAILRQLWTKEISDPNIKTTYEYVLDLRNRLEDTLRIAQQNLKDAASRYRHYYNKKARERQMKVGDKVLVMLPTSLNKLLMMWKGPFVITEKVGSVDYRIDMNGKIKTFHANMLKPYIERTAIAVAEMDVSNTDEECCLAVVEPDDVSEDSGIDHQLEETVSSNGSETYLDVHISEDLPQEEQERVRQILKGYPDVLTNSWIEKSTTLPSRKSVSR